MNVQKNKSASYADIGTRRNRRGVHGELENVQSLLTESFEKVRIDPTLQFYTKNSYDHYYAAIKF